MTVKEMRAALKRMREPKLPPLASLAGIDIRPNRHCPDGRMYIISHETFRRTMPYRITGV